MSPNSSPSKFDNFNAQGGYFLQEDISRFDATFFNIAPAEAKVKGSNTGVYTALYSQDYEKMIFRDPENLPFYAVTGNGTAMFSNRLSYFFDLEGPSLTLDTGCSGSLVALHSACTSLWAGESQQSIVAASSLILDPETMIGPSFMEFLSKHGHSYSFDSRGFGYGRGEGTACVILKSDGRIQGITMPSLDAQKSRIEKA